MVQKTLPTAVLGRTGLEVTRIGYGASGRKSPDSRQWGRLLNAVLDSGINFIDTANDYGVRVAGNQTGLGPYLHQYSCTSPRPAADFCTGGGARAGGEVLPLYVDDLIWDVLRHHSTVVWPEVKVISASHSNSASTTGVVLEDRLSGPNSWRAWTWTGSPALWLTAGEEVFRQRIHDRNLNSWKSPRERMMIDKSLEHTIIFNARRVEVVSESGLVLVDILQDYVSELAEKCLSTLVTGDTIA